MDAVWKEVEAAVRRRHPNRQSLEHASWAMGPHVLPSLSASSWKPPQPPSISSSPFGAGSMPSISGTLERPECR